MSHLLLSCSILWMKHEVYLSKPVFLVENVISLGRRLVFQGEKILVWGERCPIFDGKVVLVGENAMYLGEGWAFWEEIPYVGKKVSSFRLKCDTCGRNCPMFGRKLVFLGDNVILLEQAMISGRESYFWKKMWYLGGGGGENWHFWEKMSSFGEKMSPWGLSYCRIVWRRPEVFLRKVVFPGDSIIFWGSGGGVIIYLGESWYFWEKTSSVEEPSGISGRKCPTFGSQVAFLW